MSNDKYRISSIDIDYLLDIIDNAIYDDEDNGMFDEMKSDEGPKYFEGFNSGINYAKTILVSACIRSNRDLEIPETSPELWQSL